MKYITHPNQRGNTGLISILVCVKYLIQCTLRPISNSGLLAKGNADFEQVPAGFLWMQVLSRPDLQSVEGCAATQCPRHPESNRHAPHQHQRVMKLFCRVGLPVSCSEARILISKACISPKHPSEGLEGLFANKTATVPSPTRTLFFCSSFKGTSKP